MPAPRKSVKQMVQEYEENIISPPPEFQDNYKPVPKQRTIKSNPVPAPRTKITSVNKALKEAVETYDIDLRTKNDPLPFQNFKNLCIFTFLIFKILQDPKGTHPKKSQMTSKCGKKTKEPLGVCVSNVLTTF